MSYGDAAWRPWILDEAAARPHFRRALDLGINFFDTADMYSKARSEEVTGRLLGQAGKVRYLGASSMAAWQLAKALYLADRRGLARFVSMQNHYNLAYREEEREMVPLCLEEGLGLVPWSPLARGFLAGSRTREGTKDTARARTDDFADRLYFRPEDFDVLEATVAVAKERGVKPAQVALAWLLSRPGVAAPIV